MPNSDEHLRGQLLLLCHRLRDINGGWVPTSDINFSGDPLTPGQVASVCEQLAGANLIVFKPLKGEGTFIVGMAKITGHGSDVVNGLAIPSIAVSVAPGEKPEAEKTADHPLAGIHPSRIANWESKGVDAIEADLKYGDGIRYVGGPPGTKEQAWRWVNYVRAQNQNTPPRPEPEILTLKPGFAGVSLDLKAVFRRARRWWRDRK